MKKAERYQQVLDYFITNVPTAETELHYENPYQLLVAVILSAQCTDKRVNLVTVDVFRDFPTPQRLAQTDFDTLFPYIKSISYPNNKTKHLIGMAQMLVNDFGAVVPERIDDLVKLPGVGRKTANVILGNAFDTPGITVDTHFGRLSRRFGWTKEEDPVKVEFAIHEIFPPKYWTHLSQLVVWHGRRRCHARKPACGACPIADLCPSFGEGPTDKEIALKLVKKDSDFR